MPIDSQIRLAEGDHVVQFYEHDDELLGVVGGYLGAAVRDGDAVIVIASASHRAGFEATMADAAADVVAARHEQRLVMLDAATVLAAFMVDGLPDAVKFDAAVGGLVRLTAETGRPVRAYGEMVALLWAEGNVAGATELERLWNALGEQLPFSLFCAYPSHLVRDPAAAKAFREVCHLHSDVVAVAPKPALALDAEVTRWFAGSLLAPRQARAFLGEVLRTWGRPDLVDDASLVVAELTTNAVVHGHSDVTIGLSRQGDGIRLVVADNNPAPPVPGTPDADALGGRGLRLVEAVGERWGHEQVRGGVGKAVWVELGVSA